MASGNYDLFVARVSGETGKMIGSPVRVTSGNGAETEPSLAYGGGGYLLVWTDNRGGDKAIFGTTLASDGTPAAAGGQAIAQASGDQEQADVLFDGKNFIVTWASRGSASGSAATASAVRVSVSGAVLDSSPIVPASGGSNQEWPHLATLGNATLMVWSDDQAGVSTRISGARVDGGGSLLDSSPLVLSTGTSDRRRPAAAGSPSQALVVWTEKDSATGYDIRAVRVDTGGKALDSASLLVSLADPPEPDGGTTPDSGPSTAADHGTTPSPDSGQNTGGTGGNDNGCSVAAGDSPAPAASTVAWLLLMLVPAAAALRRTGQRRAR